VVRERIIDAHRNEECLTGRQPGDIPLLRGGVRATGLGDQRLGGFD
jgi:hypothetical protein